MRILIKLIVAFLVLVIAALVALPFIIDPNDYKDQISQQVERVTGRTLTLQGDIGLSVFPWIALELGPTSLSNASGFKADHFAQVEAAEIRIKLMPLLRKELEVDTIVLDGLVLNLETNEAGVTNWDDLTGTDADAEESESAASSADVAKDVESSPALTAISIAGVRLTNANILWSDDSKGEQFQLRNMNLTTDPLVPGKPTSVKAAFDLISAQPEARAHITLDTDLMLDLENQQYALNKLKFTTVAQSRELPVAQVSFDLRGDVHADMQKQIINIRDLALKSQLNGEGPDAMFSEAEISLNGHLLADLGNEKASISEFKLSASANSRGIPEPLFTDAKIQLSGDVSADLASQSVAIPQLGLNLEASKDKQKIVAQLSAQVASDPAKQQTQLDNLQLAATITDPDMPGGKAELNLTTSATVDLEKQTLNVADLVLQLQDLLIQAQLNASDILSETPSFNADLHINPFNLRSLTRDLQIELPEMADTSTLELFELRTKVSGSNEHIALTDLNIKLDQSTLAGQFSVRNFDKPALRFDLKLDEIDADRYLPPPSEDEKPKTSSGSAASSAEPEDLPLDAIRELNAKGKIEIGKLKISGVHSQNILLTLDAEDGLVKLSPLRAEMYQGQYQGNVVIDARNDVMKLSMDEKLQGVQAGPLLDDLTGDSKISGTVNASAKLTASGNNPDAIKQTLNGSGDFSFSEGALKGVNLADAIRRARAAISGQSLPESDEPVQTDFSSLGGSFTARNGVIDNQDFSLMSPLLRVSGAGNVDLPQESIDYALRVAVVGSLEGQGGREITDLRGLTIPVRITGSFDNPRPSVDLAGLLRDRATEELRGRAAEQIQDRLGDKVGEGLGGLLGGALAPKSNDAAPAEEAPEADSATEEKEAEPAKSPEDQLKDELQNRLRRLF
ncbi:AsmA family protein [Methylophaga lonarensis]|uniref:AsmA family protein n=1 Tax=Methylophaga lonarensis TaxID=999151 RepID=UPI003D28BD88